MVDAENATQYFRRRRRRRYLSEYEQERRRQGKAEGLISWRMGSLAILHLT